MVIPVYNECRFIGSVVLRARQYTDTIIVVDDGSSDLSGEIAKQAGAVVLEHGTNRGKTAAISTGFEYVRNNYSRRKSDMAVVLMDGDGQHRCEEIPILTAPIFRGEADIVVGSRFLGKKSRIPRWRVLGQQALTLATNISSGYNLTDSQSGFRAFTKAVLENLDFESDGFSAESEIQFLARRNQLRVVEVPIDVIYADPPKRNPFRHGLSVINGILKLVGQNRPLFFFGLGGMIILVTGLAWGGWVVEIYRRYQVLAVGYALISVLLTILGSLGLFMGVTLHSVKGLMQEVKKIIEKIGR